MKTNKKSIFAIILIMVTVIIAVFGGIYLTRNAKKSEKAISKESAEKQLEKLVKRIDPKTGNPTPSPIEYDSIQDEAAELPDIDTCTISVKSNAPLTVEIYSSPEKSGTGTDGWLTETAEKFNKNHTDKGITLRTVNSGQALDYISSKKAVPDAFTPSAKFWIDMLNARGTETETVTDRLVGNTVGILLQKDKYKEITDEYGSADLKSINQAIDDGKLVIGYTNPFASTGGMNYLITTLQRYDLKNPLSDTASEGFAKFQKNIPFVALTTIQMRDAAKNGSFDGFIMEYQSYINDQTMKDYEFIPYGYRHDNPLVAIGKLSDEKKALLKEFTEYCKSESIQKQASDYGFNQNNSYVCEYPNLDGNTLLSAQDFYKANKDSGKQIAAVFVTDVSGSMGGEPIVNLQNSLLNSMQYINAKNQIGLVSYASDVTIELPISEFDMKQQTLFKGAVESLNASGGTATFDGIIVAADMLQKIVKNDPDVRPMIFVLSDGETTDGYSLNDIDDVLMSLRIPVYTIGYNANLSALQKISSISEAASINADTDDIVYQLKMLFNANM